MTIRDRMGKELVDRGMFPAQAKEVVDGMASAGGPMDGRWDDDESGYPESLIVAVRPNVRSAALAWIDSNLPEAWYRPLVAGEAAGAGQAGGRP